MSYENPWKYKKTNVTDDHAVGNAGFVYLITNTTNNKKYIGKKLFWFSKTKTVKGKKKRTKVESDWKDYYGSNTQLTADVERLGKNKFKRQILYLCATKGECTYYEAYEQFVREVLLKEEYYNGWIHCKVSISHLPKDKQKC